MDNELFEGIDYKSFEFVKTLGKGTHGTVILAQQKNNKKKYAIKSIKKQSFDNDKQLSLIKREVEIMAALSHPHIITVHDVCESNSRVTMTLEYASGGELFDYVNESPGGLEEVESRRIFNQISSAVLYLHKKGIVHRDLKLENILLDCNGDAKIADFGLANLYSRDKLLFTYCGSPLYASPEIVKAEPYFGPEVDCWSLGVILYAMAFGVLPFDDSDVTRLKRCIINGEYVIPRHGSPSLKNLIMRMLEPTTDQRLIMKEVVGHPWLNEVADVSSSWPYYDPRRPDTSYGLTSVGETPGSPCTYPLLDYVLLPEVGGGPRDSCREDVTLGRLDENFNGCCNGDGNFSRLGSASSTKRDRSVDDFFHLSPKFRPDEVFRRSNWQSTPVFDSFPQERDSMSVRDESSDFDEEAASVPLICEVQRPKHVSLPGDVTVVCDVKTSSTTRLDAAVQKRSTETSALTRAKSEPVDLALPRAKSMASMLSSYLGQEGRPMFFREESVFEDSLNYEKGDSFHFDDAEGTDHRPSEFVRKLTFGQPDSLEGTEMHFSRHEENDDNFSVDSLDL